MMLMGFESGPWRLLGLSKYGDSMLTCFENCIETQCQSTNV